jgi:hypothetical protein
MISLRFLPFADSVWPTASSMTDLGSIDTPSSFFSSSVYGQTLEKFIETSKTKYPKDPYDSNEPNKSDDAKRVWQRSSELIKSEFKNIEAEIEEHHRDVNLNITISEKDNTKGISGTVTVSVT